LGKSDEYRIVRDTAAAVKHGNLNPSYAGAARGSSSSRPGRLRCGRRNDEGGRRLARQARRVRGATRRLAGPNAYRTCFEAQPDTYPSCCDQSLRLCGRRHGQSAGNPENISCFNTQWRRRAPR
jgi:hypothetical protein